MPKITKNQFLQEMAGKSISVSEAQNDEVLSKVDLKKADLDGDGKISGEKEMKKLFLEMDKFDRDGSYNSMKISDSLGNPTLPGKLVQSAKNLAKDETPTLASLMLNGFDFDSPAEEVSQPAESKITRGEFLQEMAGKSISLKEARGDQLLSKIDLERADLNGDGKISGEKEMKKLFLEMDKFDRDGSYNSMKIADSRGNPTLPGKLVQSAKNLAKAETQTVASLLLNGLETEKPRGESVREAALEIIEKYRNNYGVEDPWYNIDPNHNLPANVRLGGLKGRWKCNLFGGNVLYAAGFEPPYYGNKGRGEYPNANQFYKWSDKYADRYGNKVHFELRGELDVESIPPGERAEKIQELLEKAEPGDLVVVDHPGAGVADGGHVRILIQKNEDGTYDFAQASRDQAEVQREDVYEFTGEERIWILRPNRPRVEE